uniref:RUN and SH3 domain containing 1 n=1 Tax=Tetraodon nigroviridis TaxID=99883 RepID=H3DLT5_TETNG
ESETQNGTNAMSDTPPVLVGAVSDAVEAILGQFSASRTVVQKTLSGDSTINPALGRLVLQCLCPALHSLLTDGLKPHQSDLIAGRRPNSAWGLVQASTRPGPKTQILFNLQVRVSELPQLRHSKQRFNAFLLGLLNTKFLDFWLSHLHSCTDVLETYYQPASFMRLSLTACRPLFEELLLVLQPLSLLTFNLDLLFQHHRLEPDCHSPDMPSPPCQETGFQLRSQSKSRYIESLSAFNYGSSNPQTARGTPSPQAHPKNQAVESTDGGAERQNLPGPLGHTSPQLLWVQEKEIGALPPPDLEEDGFVQQAGQVPWGLGRLFGASKSPSSPQGHTPPSRRPSQWLAPGVSALTRMRRFSETLEEPEAEDNNQGDAVEIKASVRTLCDHAGTGSELTFCKGEELVVLGGVDQDWIRCRQGDREGLVPIGYTSLIM